MELIIKLLEFAIIILRIFSIRMKNIIKLLRTFSMPWIKQAFALEKKLQKKFINLDPELEKLTLSILIP